MITNQKEEYYKDKLAKPKSSKTIWKTLKSVLPNKSQTNSAPNDISANDFNDFFKNIGSSLASKFSNDTNIPWKNPECLHRFEFKRINDEEVLHSLSHLPGDSNLDILDMDTKLLRVGATFIAKSLACVFNISLKSGDIP